jgi:hypothetical protein
MVIVATFSISIAHAAFDAAVRQYAGERLMLRKGAWCSESMSRKSSQLRRMTCDVASAVAAIGRMVGYLRFATSSIGRTVQWRV